MNTRKCSNDPDIFCYICGRLTFTKKRMKIDDNVKQLYRNYFNISISNQDASWVPHTACKSCVESLRRWNNAKSDVPGMPFKIPVIWREAASHDECYFCSTNTFGYNDKNVYHIEYTNVGSVTKPISYSFDDRPPTLPLFKEEVEENTDVHYTEDRESEYIPSTSDSLPILFVQNVLDDLVRDLGLPKDKSELLGSRLQERNLLSPGTTFSWYRHREESLIKYFPEGDNYVFCDNVSNFMQQSGVLYDASQWRLFIDSSKTSLKGLLLHNSDEYASIPIAHSFYLKESHENMKTILEAIR